MQTNRHPVQIGQHFIDLLSLPEIAQRELVTFYEFLLFKYQVDKEQLMQRKKALLTEIFQEANGTLPPDYVFNREEIHER